MLIDCPECEAIVDAKVITACGQNHPKDVPAKFSFLKCSRCGQVMLAVQEDYGGGFDEDDPYRLYPPHEDKINFNIPKLIRETYAEAWKCQNAKAYTAAAIMCRKAVEEICLEHGALGRNLAASLKKLKEIGIIEARLYEWADALRITGNEAAHAGAVTISREDSKDLLDFTKALLEYVFTFRDKFEEFKLRREKRKKVGVVAKE